MTTQEAYEELVAQIEDGHPVRETVIEMLETLLDALKAGAPLPTPTGMA